MRPTPTNITCANCGKTKTLPRWHAVRDTFHFCDRKCQGEYASKHQMGENNHNYVNRIEVSCPICGKIKKVTPSKYNVSKSKTFYCSQEHRAIGVGKQQTGENHPNRVPRIKMKCFVCGKDIERPEWQIKRMPRSVCSEECRCKIHSIIHTGKNSPRYINGDWVPGGPNNPYCEKFDEDFKERVRAFFRYKCAVCESPQNGKALQCHHVDYNKRVCCDRNPKLFVPLCDKCHPRTNKDRGYWRLYFRELLALQYGGKCYYTKEEMAARTTASEPSGMLQRTPGQTQTAMQ